MVDSRMFTCKCGEKKDPYDVTRDQEQLQIKSHTIEQMQMPNLLKTKLVKHPGKVSYQPSTEILSCCGTCHIAYILILYFPTYINNSIFFIYIFYLAYACIVL